MSPPLAKIKQDESLFKKKQTHFKYTQFCQLYLNRAGKIIKLEY